MFDTNLEHSLDRSGLSPPVQSSMPLLYLMLKIVLFSSILIFYQLPNFKLFLYAKNTYFSHIHNTSFHKFSLKGLKSHLFNVFL